MSRVEPATVPTRQEATDAEFDYFGFRVLPNQQAISRQFYETPDRIDVDRAKLWQRLIHMEDYKQYASGVYEKLVMMPDNEWSESIRLDVTRTFPNHKLFQTRLGRQRLYNILKAHSYYNQVIGYCQGLSYIVATLLINSMSEEDSFWTLIALMDKIVGFYFQEGMSQLKQDSQTLQSRLKEECPRLWKLFEEHSLECIIFTSKWYLSLFTDIPNWSLVLAIWDIIFLEGRPGIFKISLAILKSVEAELLKLKYSDEIISLLLYLPPNRVSIGSLFPFTLDKH